MFSCISTSQSDGVGLRVMMVALQPQLLDGNTTCKDLHCSKQLDHDFALTPTTPFFALRVMDKKVIN